MISHSQRGGWWSLRTGWVATTRTKAKRPSTSSPAGVVRQDNVVKALGREALGERTHRFVLAVGSGDATRPAAPAVAFGHREGRLRAVDTDLGGDREHVLELPRVQLGAEAAVLAVGTVGEDRRRRQLPAGRLRAKAGGERGLRLEADRLRDLRPPPPLQVVAPLLG